MIPEEFIEGRALFEKADKENDPIIKLVFLQDGLDSIESSINDYPDEERLLILTNNLKSSQIRSLLAYLGSFQSIDIDIWFDYIIFLNCRLEIEDELQKNHHLQQNYNKFKALWIQTIKRVVSKGIVINGKFFIIKD